jgi:hypothetical protein
MNGNIPNSEDFVFDTLCLLENRIFSFHIPETKLVSMNENEQDRVFVKVAEVIENALKS